MRRFGQVIKVRPEMEEKYCYLHAHPWKEVGDTITACNIRNYSIFINDGMLFAYFEYVGDDYEGDMEKMAECPMTQKWWDECKPCHEQMPDTPAGDWWKNMKEVFYQG